MKKIILLIFTIIVVTSCLHRADEHYLRTAYGAAIIYEGTMYSMIFNEITLQTIELDIIAQANEKDHKELIKKFFPYCNLKTSDNKYSINFNNEIILELLTDGKTLTTPGAKWSFIKSKTYQDPNKKITISCLTPNSWRIESSQTYQGSTIVFNSELFSYRTNPITSPKDAIFELICDKSTFLEPERSMLHCFTTIEPLKVNYIRKSYNTQQPFYYGGQYAYSPNPYIIMAGNITDQFIHPATNKTDQVDAIIYSNALTQHSTEAKITYRELTERWDWEYIQRYHEPIYPL